MTRSAARTGPASAAAEPDEAPNEALIDALDDLAHDLGKYIALPVRWLPPDAPLPTLRAAAADALARTRRDGASARAAADLWADFCADAGAAARALQAWPALHAAVVTALAWSARLDALTLGDRPAMTTDLSAVAPAIRAALAEARGAGAADGSARRADG